MRYYYRNEITDYLQQSFEDVWAELTKFDTGDLLQTQKYAWLQQISILTKQLSGLKGHIYFEYTIPRMGKRIDVVLLINHIVFILEFKIGSKHYCKPDINQVWDYALDLKYFHEESHHLPIIPILIATEAIPQNIPPFYHSQKTIYPILSNGSNLRNILQQALEFFPAVPFDHRMWENSRYAPTPTIIEAAQKLYQNHSVQDISRSEAQNLGATSDYLLQVIENAKINQHKAICFVTGVPGAGKTLVGLNLATHSTVTEGTNAVYLSGNGPLVKVLVEALTRDKVQKMNRKGYSCTKKAIQREVQAFIQNVHHFRDTCLEGTIIQGDHIQPDLHYFHTAENKNKSYPPTDHIAIFDEAQRAWNKEQTAIFMQRKKNKWGFPYSEPEFLISCMDRHSDWAIIVCLVGGGQEINTGEAGIREWFNALIRRFPNWHIHLSSHVFTANQALHQILQRMQNRDHVYTSNLLHLATSLRSYRAENLAHFVQVVLDIQPEKARSILKNITNYPLIITRSLSHAKDWLRSQAHGSEKYGILVSSHAHRLRPLAIDIRTNLDPIHWFLENKDDIRSSDYLEDVATEFDVQGLELDYTCIVWDADFRYHSNGWQMYSFKGSKWQSIKSTERQTYLKNAYRVLLTRARQGMIIVVPEGDITDQTRSPIFYDTTYNYLKEIGLPSLDISSI